MSSIPTPLLVSPFQDGENGRISFLLGELSRRAEATEVSVFTHGSGSWVKVRLVPSSVTVNRFWFSAHVFSESEGGTARAIIRETPFRIAFVGEFPETRAGEARGRIKLVWFWNNRGMPIDEIQVTDVREGPPPLPDGEILPSE